MPFNSISLKRSSMALFGRLYFIRANTKKKKKILLVWFYFYSLLLLISKTFCKCMVIKWSLLLFIEVFIAFFKYCSLQIFSNKTKYMFVLSEVWMLIVS